MRYEIFVYLNVETALAIHQKALEKFGGAEGVDVIVDLDKTRELTAEEQELLSATNTFVEEYQDVFDALAK